MNNSKVVIILSILVGLLLGFGLYHFLMPPKIKTETVTIYDSSKEQAIIDSCQVIIDGLEGQVAQLLEDAKNIKEVVVVKEVEKIQALPISDNVELLKENLIRHGELTQETDTLPAMVMMPGKDTLVTISENNVKDVNTIAAKLRGEEEINYKLEEAIFDQDQIISEQETIILNKNSIIDNQNAIYAENVQRLNESLRIEKTKTLVGVSVLGTAAVILSIICLSK
jgi:hypothetical protein